MVLDGGIATIWRQELTSKPGEMPTSDYTLEYFKSYYAEKTIGFARHWAAKAYDRQASLMIEIQRKGGIDTSDRCELASYTDPELNGVYRIIQSQNLTNEDGLPVTDLTLERMDGPDDES